MSFHVYRAYDRSGSLLYVGATDNLERRLKAHRRDSGWWMFHTRIESDDYSSRDDALDVEKGLIWNYHPRWNRRDRNPLVPAGIAERQAAEEHVWRKLARLESEQATLRRRLEAIDEEVRVLDYAIEGMAAWTPTALVGNA